MNRNVNAKSSPIAVSGGGAETIQKLCTGKKKLGSGGTRGGKARLESNRTLSFLSGKSGAGFSYKKLSPAAGKTAAGLLSYHMKYHRNTKNSITIRYANASVIGASASTAVSRQSSALSTTVPSYTGSRVPASVPCR